MLACVPRGSRRIVSRPLGCRRPIGEHNPTHGPPSAEDVVNLTGSRDSAPEQKLGHGWHCATPQRQRQDDQRTQRGASVLTPAQTPSRSDRRGIHAAVCGTASACTSQEKAPAVCEPGLSCAAVITTLTDRDCPQTYIVLATLQQGRSNILQPWHLCHSVPGDSRAASHQNMVCNMGRIGPAANCPMISVLRGGFWRFPPRGMMRYASCHVVQGEIGSLTAARCGWHADPHPRMAPCNSTPARYDH